ncbi:MAG: hypothetical protein ACXABY_15985 [Candidatus Thorarchaeota archaeon]|jgi:hypothetical protein
MRVVRLTKEQTMWLTEDGVPMDADVYIPAHRGPGEYSCCEECAFQIHTIRKGGTAQGCTMETLPQATCPELHLEIGGVRYR